MHGDPWSRPTLKDLQEILESIDHAGHENVRAAERLELSVPAEIITARGNTIPAMTREISRVGIGLFHRGAIQPGVIQLKMASDVRTFEYRVLVEWCHPCANGMFLSGGRFLRNNQDDSPRPRVSDHEN